MKHQESLILLNPQWTISVKGSEILCDDHTGSIEIILKSQSPEKFSILKSLVERQNADLPVITLRDFWINFNLNDEGVDAPIFITHIIELVHSNFLILTPLVSPLSQGEGKRYYRQIDFFNRYQTETLNVFDIQNNLKNSKVAIIGLGGQGSIIAAYLAAVGVGHLVIVDGDLIDESNLARQILYNHDDVGKSKAITLKKRLQQQNPYISVEAVDKFIESKEDIGLYIKDVNLLALCGDKPMISLREWINIFCVDHNIPHIGVSGPWVGPLCLPRETACFECERSFYKKKYANYDGAMHWWKTFSSNIKFRPAFVFRPAASGLFIAQQVVKFLTGVLPTEVLAGRWRIDLSLNSEFESIPRNKKCNVCGDVL